MCDRGRSPLKAAAAAFSVSLATAHRWWHRCVASRSREALADRSSHPCRQPRRLTIAEEEPILGARRETGYRPARLGAIVRRARSTVWKVLARHEVSRRARPERPPPRRYERSRPGALLHVDVKRLVRFERPGHRVTGDRRRRSRQAGFDYLHCVVDDKPRYAYVELDPREDGATAARMVERFIQTLVREWAYVRTWQSSGERALARS